MSKIAAWIISIGALCVVVPLVGYKLFQWQNAERFKLTIEVQTPDGIKSGSSVIETMVWETASWGPPETRGLRTQAKGDATFTDLGGGRNLVALLAYGPESDESKIFGLKAVALGGGDLNWKDQRKLKGRGELPRDYIPTLITFSNLSDPSTARVVDPDNLERTFGPGFKLLRVLVETTSERLGPSIEKVLPWWSAPGRPAAVARRAWRSGDTAGVSVESERLFRKD